MTFEDFLLLGVVGVGLLTVGAFNYGYDLARRRMSAALWLLLSVVGAAIVFVVLFRP
jgi:hypothetical protein